MSLWKKFLIATMAILGIVMFSGSGQLSVTIVVEVAGSLLLMAYALILALHWRNRDDHKT